MISSARLGDKHVCPMPGHGTTPIASASSDVNINFMGAARVGDTCGCGAVITTGFPSILVNGRPMAHMGSPTSHGGTIITGSSDVGGGFVFGGAGNSTIINFMALGVFRPDGSVDDLKMATLLADPKLVEKATAANALIDPNEAPKDSGTRAEPEAESIVCKDPDMIEELAGYIAQEMNRNIHDSAVLKMKELLSYDVAKETCKQMTLPWYAQIGSPSPQLSVLPIVPLRWFYGLNEWAKAARGTISRRSTRSSVGITISKVGTTISMIFGRTFTKATSGDSVAFRKASYPMARALSRLPRTR